MQGSQKKNAVKLPGLIFQRFDSGYVFRWLAPTSTTTNNDTTRAGILVKPVSGSSMRCVCFAGTGQDTSTTTPPNNKNCSDSEMWGGVMPAVRRAAAIHLSPTSFSHGGRKKPSKTSRQGPIQVQVILYFSTLRNFSLTHS